MLPILLNFSTSKFYGELCVVTVPFRFEYKRKEPDEKKDNLCQDKPIFPMALQVLLQMQSFGSWKMVKGTSLISSVKMNLICPANAVSKTGGLYR